MQHDRPFIPVVDLAGIEDGGEALARAGQEIYEACTNSGFFYITHHGLADNILADARRAYRAFFHADKDNKATVAINAAHRGFSARGDALMYEAKAPDYKEFFTTGLELPADDPDVMAGQPLRGANQWPEFIAEFRPSIERFYEASAACGARLLHAVAVSLGQQPDFFAPLYQKRLQRTQGIYYPPQPAGLDDTFGVADHTDFGCITLLWQDDVGGLQVLSKSGDWVDAPPIAGTLVVNVGDLLARWTNDRFASTRHRVLNTSGRERFSIATFYDPSYDAVVDPKALGVSDHDANYPAVLAGDHIVDRINRSFGYRGTLPSA